MLELKAKGKTVVMVTHRTGAIRAADRLVILRDGRVQANGPRDEVLAALQPPPAAPSTAVVPAGPALA
jgi:ATP-binding cassette subfamily C exporter for protease/lipase